MYITFDFLVESKNVCKLVFCFFFFQFSEKFLFLHGNDCIYCVLKSFIITADRWLCRYSYPSLRTLWSAVYKSPQFSALDTTVSESSWSWISSSYRNFDPSGSKWRFRYHFSNDSEGKSWEELEAYRSSWILFTRFFLNSSSHSHRSRNVSSRTSSRSFVFGFSIFVESRDESPRTSSLILSRLIDAGCCVRVTTSFDEDEGDVGEDELEELVDKRGTTTCTWFVVSYSFFLSFVMSCVFCPLNQ